MHHISSLGGQHPLMEQHGKGLQRLKPRPFCSIVLHIILHLVISCKVLGPISSISCFRTAFALHIEATPFFSALQEQKVWRCVKSPGAAARTAETWMAMLGIGSLMKPQGKYEGFILVFLGAIGNHILL